VVSMYPKAEILFPTKLIPTLKELRGPEWAELVTRVSRLDETHPDTLAFCLMMIELGGCLNCYAGSYKFMRGCAACARQTIVQYKGTDEDLVRHFQRAQDEIQAYLEGRGLPALALLEEEAEAEPVAETEVEPELDEDEPSEDDEDGEDDE
jgi:hypothetical protein